jgi:kumamolisin
VTDLGLAPANFPVRIVVGLDLRDKADLEAFLADVSDPASPHFQHFLSQDAFNARYGPTPAEEQRVVDWLTASGFQVTERFPNRLLVGAVGDHAAVERAFGVRVHHVRWRGQDKYAVLQEPSFPADIAGFTTGVTGLDNLVEMRPRLRATRTVTPDAAQGSTCCHFSPNDLATFYTDTAGYDGSGQTIVIAGAYAWNDTDLTTFNTQWGLPPLPAGSGQVCTGHAGILTFLHPSCRFSTRNSAEISLDVEYSHGTAPAAIIRNYMAATPSGADFQVMYNRIVTDNPGHIVSTSWGSCEAETSTSTQMTNDNIFATGNAEGQSWFAASGDSGSKDCGGSSTAITVDHPANSPHIIGVGGTSTTCLAGMTSSNPACVGYGSETTWSGSGGGKSALFPKPSYQAGCNVPADGQRDVPDVSLEADPKQYGNYIVSGGTWYSVGGTSGAAPQWAGFFAELNQKKGGSGLGHPGGRIYQLCGTAAYHDITSGSNGDYVAGPGYDLTTGVGTIEAATFLAAY